MDVDAKLLEFKEVAEELERERTNFGKDSKSRKTPVYKQKKIAKATALYTRATNLIAEIATLLTEPAPCFELEKRNAEINYKNYLADLKTIPDDAVLEDEEIQIHAQKQNVRFEAVRKIIEDVDIITNSGTSPSKPYSRMKIKALNDNWQRIQMADEEFESDWSNLPAEYLEKMIDYENEVERIILHLESELDNGAGAIYQRNDDVKLPRVTIPKFYGDYFKFISISSLFHV